MTQGSPLKLILAFAVPLMLGSLFQQFYNLADTIIVGRFVGVEALAAVGSVGGGIMGVVPGVMGVAAFAPPLDDAGNSVKAQAALSDIVGRLNLNIFHPRKSILAEQA